MQPLPKGVTGFDAPDDGVPVKRFTAACHGATRQLAGRVHQVRTAYEQVTPNFHEALMTLRDRPGMVRVLCNAHYPIAVFATPAAYEGDVRLEFVDCPELAEALRAEFSIITRQEACAGVADELVAQLGEAELAEMRYWRPQRIGDVITCERLLIRLSDHLPSVEFSFGHSQTSTKVSALSIDNY